MVKHANNIMQPLTFIALALTLTVGCGAEKTEPAPADTQATDTQTKVDAGPADSGSQDDTAEVSDAAADTTEDSGADDAALEDTHTTGTADTSGTADSGASDGTASDASVDTSVGKDIEEDIGPEPDAVSGPQPCSPALVVQPSSGTILPYDLKTFSGKGGTGAYRYKLANNASGAVLNKYTGAYLSGSKTGVKDKIELSDLGCIGTAKATITVVEPLTMAPLSPWVGYKQAIGFAVKKGSGKFAFSFTLNATGASLNKNTGKYVAGSKDGDDQIKVTDTATGEQSAAVVHVRKNAMLYARPPRLAVPLGGEADVNVTGGSGHYVLTVPAGAFSKVSAKRVRANKAGVVMATVKDTFTGKSVKVRLSAQKATEVAMPTTGDGYQAARVIAVPDLDGDGGNEVVVGLAEADGNDNNGGAVYLYRSKKGGLDPKPAQILYGTGKDTRFGGYGLTVKDVDGDKRADLIVGAPLADVGTTNNGAIYVYKGLKSGKFSTKPTAILKGPFNSDQLGWGVAVCDVNGDGVMDIAGGALYAEDRGKTPIVSSVGALMVWLGHKDGYLDKPDIVRYGEIPDAKGVYKPVFNARIGWDVAAGDTNGDGICDLAVSSLYYKDKTANDGLVVLYLGRKADAKSIGGPTDKPVRMWSGAKTGEYGTQFGRSIALADIDGDGQDELVAGQLNWRGSPAKPGRGAVRIFNAPSSSLKPATKVESATSAAWSIQGPNNYDYFGYRVAVADATGDDIPDVLVHGGNAEVPKGPVNAGTVMVFSGRKGLMPKMIPNETHSGLKGGDYFGLSVDSVGDLDGDKLPDLVAFAGQDDTLGYNVGRPYFVPSKAGAKMSGLQMPNKASGNRYGWDSRFIGDVNGDGFNDLAVCAPFDPANKAAAGAKPAYVGTRAGAMYVYKGNAAGVDTSKPAWKAVGHYSHSAHDYFAWKVAPGGDFDGDGLRDVAVMARADDRPTTHGSGYTKGTKCGPSKNNSAAAWIFKGNKGGWPTTNPSWVAWGPQTNQYADGIAMGMDINGDGKGDLVLSALSWDAAGRTNAGGWAVYYGRPKASQGIRVACAPNKLQIGAKSNDYLGRSVTALHDIDGDGCDEFAVGADGEDHGLSAQGTVHIVYGWGANCAANVPREVVLTAGTANARAGISLDSGADIDGDKLGDLVVGGYNFSDGTAAVGAAWVITGKYLKTLKPTAIVDGKPPAKLYPMTQPGSKLRLSVSGETAAGQFGWSVSFVPGLEKNGRAGLLVGSPNGNVRSGALTGGAELFRWYANSGLALHPMMSIAGESHRPSGKLGYTVAGGLVKAGKPVVVMSGYTATPKTSKMVDQGAAYVLTVPQP
ncbi:MAG: FG-GAP repeat protein [Myxococcales bacterium]|nr:FG-GAP repeat protein [Myxococcales bacterium]